MIPKLTGQLTAAQLYVIQWREMVRRDAANGGGIRVKDGDGS
jgi:hypothetical protein